MFHSCIIVHNKWREVKRLLKTTTYKVRLGIFYLSWSPKQFKQVRDNREAWSSLPNFAKLFVTSTTKFLCPKSLANPQLDYAAKGWAQIDRDVWKYHCWKEEKENWRAQMLKNSKPSLHPGGVPLPWPKLAPKGTCQDTKAMIAHQKQSSGYTDDLWCFHRGPRKTSCVSKGSISSNEVCLWLD